MDNSGTQGKTDQAGNRRGFGDLNRKVYSLNHTLLVDRLSSHGDRQDPWRLQGVIDLPQLTLSTPLCAPEQSASGRRGTHSPSLLPCFPGLHGPRVLISSLSSMPPQTRKQSTGVTRHVQKKKSVKKPPNLQSLILAPHSTLSQLHR